MAQASANATASSAAIDAAIDTAYTKWLAYCEPAAANRWVLMMEGDTTPRCVTDTREEALKCRQGVLRYRCYKIVWSPTLGSALAKYYQGYGFIVDAPQ